MTKPGDDVPGDEKADELPKLARETLEDLDANNGQAEDVKGGGPCLRSKG